MNKHTLKTLSLSFLAVALAAATSANEQKTVLQMATGAVAADRTGCSAQQEIDRGWAYQRGLLEGRLEAKASEVLEVKGAIISPPLPGFAPQAASVASAPAKKNEAKKSVGESQPSR